MAKPSSTNTVEPDSFSSRDWPVHSNAKPAGSWAARRSISSSAWPVLWPGAASPDRRMVE